jgi:cytochrome c-type biogenesis protein CcmH
MMRWLLMLSVFVTLPAWAVIETYQFDSDADKQRYQQFIEELRCPKCQNQNLAGSNSPIAKDLRHQLYQLIDQQKTDQAIEQFMVERYGNFVLYRPPVDKNTVLLWLAPAVLLLMALLSIILFRIRNNRQVNAQALTADEQQQLDQLLQRYSK